MFRILLVNDEDLNGALEILFRSLGGFHYYYAKVCIENGICRFLNLYVLDETVGSIIYYEVKGLVVIYYIAVDRRYRARGLGKILVASVEELYGDDYVYLASTTLSNDPAIRMFKELGYEVLPIDQLYESYGDRIDNLIKLTCSYDDDAVIVKNTDIESLIKYLDSIKREVNKLWMTNCYQPWLRFRRRY